MPRCIVRWPTEVVRYKGRTRDCGSQLHPGRPGKGDRDAWSAQRTHSQGCVLVKRVPLQSWVAERARELAQQESSHRARGVAGPRCIRVPTA